MATPATDEGSRGTGSSPSPPVAAAASSSYAARIKARPASAASNGPSTKQPRPASKTRTPFVTTGPPTLALGPPHHNTTTRDIERFVGPTKMLGSFVPIHYYSPPNSTTAQPVKLGTMLPQVFAVFSDPSHVDEMIRTAEDRKTREYCNTLNPSASSYQDLLASVFPTYVKGTPEAQAVYVTRESVDSLLKLCKDPVGQPNRHMDRPFIAATAIIKLFPWHSFAPYSSTEPSASLLSQRDLCFELASKSLLSLYYHLTNETISKTAYRRVTDMFCEVVFKCFMRCPGFTIEEKRTLMKEGNWEPSYLSWADDIEMPLMVIWGRKAAQMNPPLPSPLMAGSTAPEASKPPVVPVPVEEVAEVVAPTPEPVVEPTPAATEPETKNIPAPAAVPPVVEKVVEKAASPVPVKEKHSKRERKTSVINTANPAPPAEPSPAPTPESPHSDAPPRKTKQPKSRPDTPKNKKAVSPPASSPVPETAATLVESKPSTDAETMSEPELGVEVEVEVLMGRIRSRSVPRDREPRRSKEVAVDTGSPRDDSRAGSPLRGWNPEAQEFESNDTIMDADIIFQAEPSPDGNVPMLSQPPVGAFAPAPPMMPVIGEAPVPVAREKPPVASAPSAFAAQAAFYGQQGYPAQFASAPPPPAAALPPHPAQAALALQASPTTGSIPQGAFTAAGPAYPPSQGSAPRSGSLPPPSPTIPAPSIGAQPPMSSTATFLQHLISDRLMSEQQYRQVLYSQIERNWLEHLEGWYQMRRSAEIEGERRRWAEVEAVTGEVWQLCAESGMDMGDDGSVVGMLRHVRRWLYERTFGAGPDKRAYGPGNLHGHAQYAPVPPPMGYQQHAPPPQHHAHAGMPPPGAVPKTRGFVDPAILSYRTNSPHSSVSSAGDYPGHREDGGAIDLPAQGLYPLERNNTSQTMVEFPEDQILAASAAMGHGYDGAPRHQHRNKPHSSRGTHRPRPSDDRSASMPYEADIEGMHHGGSKPRRGRSGDKKGRPGWTDHSYSGMAEDGQGYPIQAAKPRMQMDPATRRV